MEPKQKKSRHRPSVAIGLWIIKRIERVLLRYSLVPDTPFQHAAVFPWVRQLESHWRDIRAELEQVLQRPDAIPNFQDISRDQVNITQDDRWKTFFLYGYGYRMDHNCARCPETTRIVESIPGMFTAFFSVLAPGKHIPLHRGPYKGVLRCHLGLIVPEPGARCRIEVGGQEARWEEGKCLVFDDTYKHQVHNDTPGMRVVLFLDIVRPLRFPGSWLNYFVLRLIRLSPFIRDAVKNQQAWERRLGEY
ncbi:MAG: aspartyl/asparaginyl beta-hydroxylase domain-containing protein [Gammaproteobacteria bacterium]|nr:aspartyl/asparaginyl beta-hydroxylase domain-containing protein [Gammaproteobacteria bacterium]